jgi:hypothetical protein
MKPQCFAIVLCLGAIVMGAEQDVSLNFDSLKVGTSTEGWKGGFYGKDGKPRWSVVSDAAAPSRPNILKQDGKATYNWLVKDGISMQDGSVRTSVRIDSGKEDPEAGVIWRFKDRKNYYYVRANALEKNVIFYRMFKGKKELVKTVDLPIGFGEWHELGAQFQGPSINIQFDGKTVLSVQDSKIPGAGGVGLFTMADTICGFDDFQAKAIK